MFITKKALARRTFLRGMGATVALPLLDAMVPALSAMSKTAAQPVRRLGCVYAPNGYIAGAWVPAKVGAGFELTPSLSPLAAVQDQLIVLSGLAHREANTKGDGNGDHPRGTAVWLSGVHAWAAADSKTGQTRLATTADQLAAQELGKDTPLPSLELTLEGGELQSGCDSNDCFFGNTISWRSATTPAPMENHPRVVFERLFGDGGNAAQRLAQMRTTGSLLDSVVREVAGLEQKLGSSDRGKLTEYLDSVREVERRVQGAEQHGVDAGLALPERPIDIPENYEEHARLMFDLQTLAYQADITRVFTLLMGREFSNLSFPHLGLPEQHHSVSHHQDKPDMMAKKAQFDRILLSQFGYFVEKLRVTPDGDGSLLDHALLLYGGGLGDGNQHDHVNLPCIIVGGACGQLTGGRHLNYPDAPMANLLLSVLDKLGVPTPETIGDSTRHLSGL